MRAVEPVAPLYRACVDPDEAHPALTAHAARCEALPVFAEIAQPLMPPSGD
jgi:hypothetical protein